MRQAPQVVSTLGWPWPAGGELRRKDRTAKRVWRLRRTASQQPARVPWSSQDDVRWRRLRTTPNATPSNASASNRKRTCTPESRARRAAT
jgi:hypothetical protein